MGVVAVDPADLTASGERALHRIARLPLDASVQAPRQWVLVSSVAVVEAHVATVLRALVARSNVDSTPIGASLLAAVRDDMTKTWDARMWWLGHAFGVQVGGDAPYQRFRTVVELRNALLHGDGELTDLQTRSVQKTLALKKELLQVLNVDLRGRRVVLGDDSHTRGCSAARTFVVAFDKAVLALHPEFAP